MIPPKINKQSIVLLELAGFLEKLIMENSI